MASLFFILFLAVSVFFGVKTIKEGRNDNGDDDVRYFYFAVTVVSAIIAFVLFIWVFILMYMLGTAYTVDEKIAMYEAENTSIEESIDATVKNYMNFEAATYAEFKDEDAINLVSLFPELKSDVLVQQQIEVYVANNQKIKELKEKKIDLSKVKWHLYFGR